MVKYSLTCELEIIKKKLDLIWPQFFVRRELTEG